MVYLYESSQTHLGYTIALKIMDTGTANQFVEVHQNLNPSQATIIPRYALIYDKAANELALGGVGYDEQAGQIIVAGPADANGNPQFDILAVVFDYAEPGGWPDKAKRLVALVEFDSGKGVYVMTEWRNAPQLIEITDNDGNKVYVVLGFPWIVAAILATLAISGGIAAYGYYKHADARQKMAEATQRVVDYALQHNDTELLHAVFVGTGIRYEADSNGSIMDSIKRFISEFGAPLAAIGALILMVFKWQVILEFFRSLRDMFRRR